MYFKASIFACSGAYRERQKLLRSISRSRLSRQRVSISLRGSEQDSRVIVRADELFKTSWHENGNAV